jgi:hypothetical protein
MIHGKASQMQKSGRLERKKTRRKRLGREIIPHLPQQR